MGLVLQADNSQNIQIVFILHMAMVDCHLLEEETRREENINLGGLHYWGGCVFVFNMTIIQSLNEGENNLAIYKRNFFCHLA